MNHPVGTLLVVVALAGCGEEGPIELDTDVDVQRLGMLPGLRATADGQLQGELARIEQEGGTPELLRREIPDAENVWKGLERLILPNFRESNAKKSAKLFNRLYFRRRVVFRPRVGKPYERHLVIDPTALAEAIGLWEDKREDKEKRQLAARAALLRPHCDFGIDPMMGRLADLSPIDSVRVFAHTEALLAAYHLGLEQASEAVEPVEMMLRWADLLARQKHFDARSAAAGVRHDALVVVQAIVDHPKPTREELEKLSTLLEQQLNDWPVDAETWIGDRASGLHSYELVRGGHFDLLAGDDQLKAFDEEQVADDVESAVMRHVDEDELFYLQTMRKIIAVTGVPHAQRTAASLAARQQVFSALDQQLKRRRYDVGTVVAVRILLSQVRPATAIMAQDRAACEAWALALAAALGKPRPSAVPQLNPLTGSEYRTRRETRGQHAVVIVWHSGSGIGGAEQPVLVPIREAGATGE